MLYDPRFVTASPLVLRASLMNESIYMAPSRAVWSGMPVALYGLPLLIIGIAPSRSLSCHSDRKPNSNITQVIVVVFLRGWVVVDYFINEEW